MIRYTLIQSFFVIASLAGLLSAVQPKKTLIGPYASWSNGPGSSQDFFPIAVWLQNPRNAPKYRKAGFNTYVGLWKGPTESQLAQLKQAGMKVICHQNEVGLKHRNDPTIIAWMHGDEPDNAQSLGKDKGYGPPIAPAKIVADYQKIKAADHTRPILLNLGQGVAWDGWHGRGIRTNHPEDYPEYLKGCDIASFDIYPVVHAKPQVAGKLWYVPRGVERLIRWTEGKKPVWNCIECTRINNPTQKATPHQVRAEVWMALIHGSRGIIYFVHEWKPRFQEAALLTDPEMLTAVTILNKQIAQLAPVLNAPTITDRHKVASDPPTVPIAALMKKHNGAAYLLTVAMRGDAVTATFTLADLKGKITIEVLGENRRLTATDGVFHDRFRPWDVHLYRLRSDQ